MIRAGVLGPGDVKQIAPWCVIPRHEPAVFFVLFAVVDVGLIKATSVTVERYIFEPRNVAGVPSLALQGVILHSLREPYGVPVQHDKLRLYWPPLDVAKAAELQARGGGRGRS